MTSSVVDENVSFQAAAELASMADMRRKADRRAELEHRLDGAAPRDAPTKLALRPTFVDFDPHAAAWTEGD